MKLKHLKTIILAAFTALTLSGAYLYSRVGPSALAQATNAKLRRHLMAAIPLAAKDNPLTAAQRRLLKNIVQDGVITDEELLAYGMSVNVFTLLTPEEMAIKEAHYQNQAPLLRKQQLALLDSLEKNSLDITLQENQGFSLDQALQLIRQNGRDCLMITSTTLANHLGKVAISKEILQKIQAEALLAQQRLGLKDLPVILDAKDHSEAWAADTVVFLSVNQVANPYIRRYTMTHEFGHLKARTAQNAVDLFQENCRHYFTGQHGNPAEEITADSLAAEADPQNLQGAFEVLLNPGKFITTEQFLAQVKKTALPELNTPYLPAAARIRRMMMITARKYAY